MVLVERLTLTIQKNREITNVEDWMLKYLLKYSKDPVHTILHVSKDIILFIILNDYSMESKNVVAFLKITICSLYVCMKICSFA